MEKQLADQMMESYFPKIYGFAVKKAYSNDEAQELCAEMVKEVYLSLLSAEALANPDGYVWRICSNVFARHVQSKKKQGISPIEALGFSHNGRPDPDGGPEKYLSDSINLNIVYSVYETPRTKEEIAQELGITPVFLEDKIAYLENNGFLVKLHGDRYTTYVDFSPRTYSLEQLDKSREVQLQVVRGLLEKYVPKVRASIADFQDLYIPGGNRELFEAAVIFYAITNKCQLEIQKDLGKYLIKTLGGGMYFASVQLKQEAEDREYKMTHQDTGRDYFACGDMTRQSEKYEGVYSLALRKRSWS